MPRNFSFLVTKMQLRHRYGQFRNVGEFILYLINCSLKHPENDTVTTDFTRFANKYIEFLIINNCSFNNLGIDMEITEEYLQYLIKKYNIVLPLFPTPYGSYKYIKTLTDEQFYEYKEKTNKEFIEFENHIWHIIIDLAWTIKNELYIQYLNQLKLHLEQSPSLKSKKLRSQRKGVLHRINIQLSILL